MPIHECIRFRGSGRGCENCKVKKRDLCDDLTRTLQRIESNLRRFPLFSEKDREDIIDVIMTDVMNGIHNFRGDSAFGTWVWAIYRRIRSKHRSHDYVPLEDMDIENADHEQMENKVLFDQVLSALRKFQPKNPECAQLITFFYEMSMKGKTQKEMAEEIGMVPNSFNVKLSRCIQKFREELDE